MTSDLITRFTWPAEDFSELKVLDLACGSGRNGIWFANKGAEIHFIDRDLRQLEQAKPHYPRSQFSQWDMEAADAPRLAPSNYDIILVFNYLHRPLFPQLAEALKPGGLMFYETFTHEQAQIGRPKNPNFLLQHDELLQAFKDWSTLHYTQGKMLTADGSAPCYKAQLITRKPEL